MSNNTVKARVQIKADTSANWAQYGNSIIPLLREPIFYSDTGEIKLGDGVHNVNELPFFGRRQFVQSSEPIDAQIGDIWVDTTETTTLYTAEEASF